ncbi:MAG: hypothetical protein MJ174_02945 [Treponema sp.]|nr:hypothetical protein [Treponema sp.]
MADNFSLIKKFFLAVMLIFTSFVTVFAQNAENSAYYITEDENGRQVVHQQFRWNKNDDVLKYTFLMEKKNKNGDFVQIYKEETVETKVETTLEAGEYRYKIYAYNFLGLLEVETEWISIEIIKAYQPTITGLSPSVIYLEEDQDGKFWIDGTDLTENTLFSLSTSHKNEDGKYKAEILDVNKNNKHVQLQFDPDDLDTGVYSLIATNPGGLRYFYDSLQIKWKKPIDFDVSAGYAPLFVIYDDTFSHYFDSIFMGLSPNVRITFVPYKRKTSSFGIALSTTGTYVKNPTESYTISGYLGMANLQLVYQKYLYKRKFMLDVHAGAGITGLYDFKFAYPINGGDNVYSVPFNNIYVNANAGFCFQYYFTKRFYTEFGADYQHSFIDGMMLGTVQPSLSFGYQF